MSKSVQSMLIESMAAAGITSPSAQAAVLANIEAESNYRPIAENPNYTPEQAVKVFPKYFPGGVEQAREVMSQGKEALFNYVYSDNTPARTGKLGNTDPGDGYKYRGRGFIQLTGKDAYRQYSQKVFGDDRLVENPDLMLDAKVSADVSVKYLQDRVKGEWNVRNVTKAVGPAQLETRVAERTAIYNNIVNGATPPANGLPTDSIVADTISNEGSASKYNYNVTAPVNSVDELSESFNDYAKKSVAESRAAYQADMAYRYAPSPSSAPHNPFGTYQFQAEPESDGRNRVQEVFDTEEARKDIERRNAFGGGALGLIGAHFAESQDRFHTSVAGSAYRAIVDTGWTPGALATAASANGINGADEIIGSILSGEDPFSRREADFTARERLLMVNRFEKNYGVSMDADYQQKLMTSGNRQQATDIYGAAGRHLETSQRMSESGILANLGAGMVASIISPQDLPANALGGLYVKGASALAKSAMALRLAEKSALSAGVRTAIAGTVATPARAILSEGLVSGVASAAAQSTYDTQYTMADAAADVLMGAGAGLGLHGIATAVHGVGNKISGRNFLDGGLSSRIAADADAAVEATRQAATELKAEIGNKAASDYPNLDPADAVNQAQADMISGKAPQNAVIMRQTVAHVANPTNSPELQAKLTEATLVAKAFRFSRDFLSGERKSWHAKVASAERSDAFMVEQGQKRSQKSAEVHSQRIQSADKAVLDSQSHVDARVKQEADAKARLDELDKTPVEATQADLEAIKKTDESLAQSTSKLEALGKQADEAATAFNKLTADLEALRAKTGDAKKLDAAANKVAAVQVKQLDLREKIAAETKKAESINSKLEELHTSPKEANALRERDLKKAQDEHAKAQENLKKAQEINASRVAEADSLKDQQLPTADEITEQLRSKRPTEPTAALTIEEIEDMQEALNSVSLQELAKPFGVKVIGNDLAGAIRKKFMDENSIKTEAVMAEDARVASKDETVRKVNKAFNKTVFGIGPGKIFNTIGTTLVSSKSALARVIGRLVLENSSGAYGGVTAAIEKLNLQKAWIDPILASYHAAFDAFGEGAGFFVKARSPILRQKFAQIEGNLLSMRLGGASNAELKAKMPEIVNPMMEKHLDNLVETLENMNQARWASAGNAGKAPKLDHIPIRWNHAALAEVAKSGVSKENMRQALVDSVKSRRDERITAGKESSLTDQEIVLFVDDYMNTIFKVGDGSSFGSISIKNREFNLWKATEEMAATGRVEINAMRSSGWKKLEDLYREGRSVDKDLSVKFALEDGKVISLDQLTNPSATDMMQHLANYNSGIVALRNVGIDLENPKTIQDIRSVMTKQSGGEVKAEMDALDSMVSQFIGRPYKNAVPNKQLELVTSLARANMLGGLVFAQLAETANIFAHVGMVGGVRIIAHASRLRREAKGRAFGRDIDFGSLADIEKHVGYIGSEGYRMGAVYDPNENLGLLEMMDLDGEKALEKATRFSKNIEQLQAHITWFTSLNAVMKRGVAEEYLRNIATSVRRIQEGKAISKTTELQLQSAGIGMDRLQRLAKEDGVFHWEGNKFMGTSVEKIGDATLAADLISGVRRGMGQAIQETFIGEAGTWVHSPALRFLAMFRGYMIGSITKQMVRQYSDFGASRFAVNALVGSVLGASVIYAREALNSQFMTEDKKKEAMESMDDPMHMAQNALQYSSSLGVAQELVNALGAFSGTFEWTTRMGSQSGFSEWLPGVSYGEKVLRGLAAAGTTAANNVMPGEDGRDSERIKELAKLIPMANSTYAKATLGSFVDQLNEDGKAERALERKRAKRLEKFDAEPEEAESFIAK